MKKSKKEKRNKIQYGSAKSRAEQHDSGFDSKALNKPEGFSWFRLERPGTYTIDIIPYKVGKGNPCADESMVYYERTYYIHRNVGPNNDTICCPAKTFNKRCYVCETQAKMRRKPNANKDAIKALNWSERQLFLVKEHVKPGQEDKGIQPWDISHFCFGKLLDTRVRGSDDDDNYENFFHLENGLKLKITVTEEDMGERSFFKVSAIDFKPRKEGEGYDESILDEVPCLDDIPKELSYEQIKKMFLAGDDDEGDEDEEDTKKKKKPKKKEDDDDEEESDEDEDDESEDEETDDDEDDEEDEDGGEDDDDDDGSGDDDGDDEDEDDGDDESEDEEEDDEGYEPKKGEEVTFKKKKKTLTGIVKKANSKSKMALIEVEDEDRPIAVPFSDIIGPVDEDDDEEDDDDDDDIPFDDDEEDEDEDDDEPKKKRKKGK